MLLPSGARGAGADWTGQQGFGPPYTGITFGERFRYVSPQILPFMDGTAEGLWTDSVPDAAGIFGRHLGADAMPIGDAYVVGTPPAAVGVPRWRVAPLTGSLGVIVMDATISNIQRQVYGELLGPSGPIGSIFEISAPSGSVPVGDFDVASNGSGSATVAWSEYDGTTYAVKERRITAAGVSGAVETVSAPIERSENSVAANSVEVRGHGDGTASIAWSESRTISPLSGLNVRRVGATGVIGGIHEIASGTRVQPPRIAAHNDGSVTIVWGEAGSSDAEIYVTRVTAGGAVGAPEHACALGLHQSKPGLQCLDIAGSYGGSYEIAPTVAASAIVVARRPQSADVAAWDVDDLGNAGAPSVLETADADPASRQIQMVNDGEGNAMALWSGKVPSSTLPALRAARIGSDGVATGAQTLFPLADGLVSLHVLARPAPGVGAVGALPIWAAWGDWTADPTSDATSTRQVYAARHPFPATPPPSTTCPAVQLIGAAGSGENGGPGTDRGYLAALGAPVGAFSNALKQQVEGIYRLGAYARPIPLGMPWADVPIGPDLDRIFSDPIGQLENLQTAAQAFLRDPGGKYMMSVDAGTAALSGLLAQELNRPCVAEAKTRVVLAGYSQGAHVIGDTLERLPSTLRSRVTRVVLFGDPRFAGGAAEKPVHLRSSYVATDTGALGAREPTLGGYFIYSFCRALDPICQGVKSLPDLSAHAAYTTYEAQWAANMIGADLPGAKPKSLKTNLAAQLTTDGRSLRVTCDISSAGTCFVRATSTAAATQVLYGLGDQAVGLFRLPGEPPFVSGKITITLAASSSAPGFKTGSDTKTVTCVATRLGDRTCK